MSAPLRLPRFKELLKSREVEDPVNLWLHRPLAYAFVWATFRTRLTPNGITALAALVGVVAGAAILRGEFLVGGLLLWASAILDGADGLMARAKKMSSPFGRALDGTADVVVAVATVLPTLYHATRGDHAVPVWWGVLAIVLTVPHLMLYDFYKESYLRATRVGRGGESSDPEDTERLIGEAKARGFLHYFSVRYTLVGMIDGQRSLVDWLDPLAASPVLRNVVATEETAAAYRRHNRLPMRLWAAVSLAPHSYLMALSLMAGRPDIYVLIRLFMMNALFASAVLMQRSATRRTWVDRREINAMQAAQQV